MATLLLIDTQVRQYETIASAAKPTTTVILFNSFTDTLDSIVAQVSALPSHSFTAIGLVQDGTDRMIEYRIVQSQTPCELFNLPTVGLESWNPVILFLTNLKTLTGAEKFDFISCLLDRNPGFDYAIDTISTQIGMNLEAAKDKLGNLAAGGTWTESDGDNIATIFFTDAISQFTGLLYSNGTINSFRYPMVVYNYVTKPGGPSFPNNPGWAMVGDLSGIDVSGVDVFGKRKVLKMLPINTQSLTAWGSQIHGGSLDGQTQYRELSGALYTAIAANYYAFVALDISGHITAWGRQDYGGSLDGQTQYRELSGAVYTAIAGNGSAFAALDVSGHITAWGRQDYGGSLDGQTNYRELSGAVYTAIAGNYGAFAALDASGHITAWGDYSSGGSLDEAGFQYRKLSGAVYTAIAANGDAFAALDISGHITAWGNQSTGGSLDDQTEYRELSGAVYKAIAANFQAFAALDISGHITAWGAQYYGGSLDGQTQYRELSGAVYTAIAANHNAFAALDVSGHITAWGDQAYGGSLDGQTN